MTTRRGVALVSLWTLGALVLLQLEAEPARAHSVVFAQSKIHQRGEVVRYELAVSYHELSKRIDIESTDSSSTPLSASTDEDRNTALRRAQAEVESYLGSHIRVALDSKACDPTLNTTDVMRFRGELFAVLLLAYRCPSATGSYEVHYDLFFDSRSEVEMTSHANLVDYQLAGAAGRFVFEPGNERLTVPAPHNDRSRAGGPSAVSSSGRFIVLGLEHILGGIDHVLFVLVLLLGARHLTGLLKVATAFTVAHSVTLALASLGWVSVPPNIVEPLIALSIAYVAVENIARGESKHRPLVVFGFGLLHGLGFAEALGFTGEVDWSLVASLFAFNAGIELGQIMIMVLVWPALLLARRLRWRRLAQMGASGLIAGFGILWFVDRLVLV